MALRWELQTSGSAAGAVAVVAIVASSAGELDRGEALLGFVPPPEGRVVLRDLLGIDRGLAARWSPTILHLMPHGGLAVVRSLAAALTSRGIAQADATDPRSRFPEAGSLLEARMLEALSRAHSPLALDLLLDQPARWPLEAHDTADPSPPSRGEAPSLLSRLIDPPLVVALGPPNIGKSSLVNALAGRHISIVADEPGTTRDHVGVTLDLAGLVVRYLDTPGLRPDRGALESAAVELALSAAANADLLLLCGDAAAPPVEVLLDRPRLRIALRSDLGAPTWSADATVTVRQQHGLQNLVQLIRETLVPAAALNDPRPWRFWNPV
jgi:hypothetical protein